MLPVLVVVQKAVHTRHQNYEMEDEPEHAFELTTEREEVVSLVEGTTNDKRGTVGV